MFSLAPFYYSSLLSDKNIISEVEFYNDTLVDNNKIIEANAVLNPLLRPSWLSKSSIYKDCDGSGAAKYQNIAVYKAISEALERYAFYTSIDSDQNKKFCFDVNPSTTGLASFPFLTTSPARQNAKAEAIERWAIHEFNKGNVPVIKRNVAVSDIIHYELITPFRDVKVSLLSLNQGNFYTYGFAASFHLQDSYNKAMIELSRNCKILKKIHEKGNVYYSDYDSAVDRTLVFFSTDEGHDLFLQKIKSAPSRIANLNPVVICDSELKGPWSKYTRVWRYLLEDSYFDCSSDHTFFMF